MSFAAPLLGGVTKFMKQQQGIPMAFHSNTIETCEGTACARCKINIDLCACLPRRLAYRSVSERISGQGIVPETEERRAA